MKLKLVMLVAIVAAFTFTSCKKEYTCECTTTAGGTSLSASTTVKDTKKKAKEACENGSSSAGGVTVECKIK